MSPDGAEGRTEELTQQVVHLGSLITELADHVKALEVKNAEIDAELLRARSIAASATDSPKSELRSVKKLYPDKFSKGESFKEWAEEFLRWIKVEDKELEEFLRQHQSQKRSCTFA